MTRRAAPDSSAGLRPRREKMSIWAGKEMLTRNGQGGKKSATKNFTN